MSTKMKALVIDGPRQAVVRDVDKPLPKAGEVIIKVERVGICGTDLHIFQGEYLSPYPIIPGHEFSGIVVETGAGVTHYQPGDRVCGDPSLFCGACRYCLTNLGNHCENWNAIGVTVHGAMAEYASVPAANLAKLPDSMSFAEGAFVEPVACVVHAMNRLAMKAGDRALLFGAGAMGQQLVQAFVNAGAGELVVVDTSETKLELARQWGATKTVLAEQAEQQLSSGEYARGFDIVTDATGIPSVIEQAFRYMGPAAKYLQFGVTDEKASIRLSPFDLYHKDWTLIGSMAINHTFLPALEWVKAGRIRTEHLVTRTISLGEVPEWFSSPRDPRDLKVQITF